MFNRVYQVAIPQCLPALANYLQSQETLVQNINQELQAAKQEIQTVKQSQGTLLQNINQELQAAKQEIQNVKKSQGNDSNTQTV
jgi:prefoldin subunit 5